MHFGPKRTAGISGHYSEARSGSMRKSSGDAEAGGKQWKLVEDKRKVRKTCGSWWKTRKGSEGVRKGFGRFGRGAGGSEEVRKAVGKCGRGGKGTGSNGTLQYLPLKAEPSRPKYRAVINKAGRSKSLVPTHTSPS